MTNSPSFMELKVAAGSPAAKVAGAIFRYMQDGSEVSLISMGAGAVNQAVKAVILARGLSSPLGWDLKVIPCFSDEMIDGCQKTAVRFLVVKR